jgi:predicted secreted protein
MRWVTGIAVYVCIWWVVIFAVLPWGVRPQQAPRPGFDPGAPENPALWKRFVATTLISALLWLGYYWLATSNLVSFREP